MLFLVYANVSIRIIGRYSEGSFTTIVVLSKAQGEIPKKLKEL